jgi:hypothetical protein
LQLQNASGSSRIVAGKPGRSGRKRIGGPKGAVQYRGEEDELEALDRLVADEQNKALVTGHEATRASVVRGIVRAALITKGYLDERAAPSLVKKPPKRTPKRSRRPAR